MVLLFSLRVDDLSFISDTKAGLLVTMSVLWQFFEDFSLARSAT